MKTERIESVKKRFNNEWLLISVDEIDKATAEPVKGRLIAHSPDRDVIYKKSMAHKGTDLITFSQDKLPKGYAYAF
jgi:hypothetical protein